MNVCLLWHMHQPYYRDPTSDAYILPWVRLHGIKGYADMLAAVERYPEIRVTFNLTPCLVQQLYDLASDDQSDRYFDLSAKPAGELDPAEKRIILRRFFSANWENMVLRYPRYRDLLHRRGRQISDLELDSAGLRFAVSDWRDLQVWFNLTWFGWAAEERYAQISELKRQGRNFSEDEKLALLNLHKSILKELLPAYARAWQGGLVEVSTSPYYHPILPLLVDNYTAKISQPQDDMPKYRFQRLGDAREQLRRGRDLISRHLGHAPAGLWPSEGSVSPAVCELADEAGFQWLATDESVLLATLGQSTREEAIYSTYLAYDGGPTLFFRDRFLSDAIGFRYAHNSAKQSVDDLVGHLENIAASHPQPEQHVVAIILDGENAWEYFPDGGRSFLETFYARLSDHPNLMTTTLSQYASEHPAQKTLPPIFPASWIRGSFRIWIGEPVKNAAWDHLKQSADAIEKAWGEPQQVGSLFPLSAKGGGQRPGESEAAAKAQEWLLIAEGSDWFWWFGDPNSSDFDSEFDQLFRFNLMQVYKELGLEIPEQLYKPIAPKRVAEEIPLFPMQPIIDGRESTFYEWVGARSSRASDFSGSMNLSTSYLASVFYGISESHLFLRVDPTELFRQQDDMRLIIRFLGSGQPMLRVRNFSPQRKPEAMWCWEKPLLELPDVAFDRILELALPFHLLPGELDEVFFAIMLFKGNLQIERWPREGSYVCPRPTIDYLTKNWVV